MKIILALVIIVIFGVSLPLYPCTVFYATDGNTMLGGNNEDWSDSNTKIWFFPPEGGKHGWVKFGFAGGYPQGGMNDQGLFWDGTGCAYLEMPYSEANKVKYNGPLMEKVIQECASVEEALIIFENYYCDDQYKAQYLIGDARGSSMIVEGDSVIMKNGNYQVATNFYHSHPELGGYPSRRYKTAVSMLNYSNELSLQLFGSILSATHQEGDYPTQYSNIYDLKNCVIYLFHFHNFEEFVTINLKEELKKGSHSYYLRDLFSKIHIISPKQNNVENPSSVTFKWEGKITSNYDLYYSKDPNFTDSEPMMVAMHHSFIHQGTLFSSFIFGIILIGGINRKNKKLYLFIVMILVILLVFINCKDEITSPSNTEIGEISRIIENLEPNMTYYWKVAAYPTENNDFSSESIVHTFTTED
jgi:hypothetical protein